MIRLTAFIAAIMVAVPLSILLGQLISAPGEVEAGLAGCFAIGFSTLFKSKLTQWRDEQG